MGISRGVSFVLKSKNLALVNHHVFMFLKAFSGSGALGLLAESYEFFWGACFPGFEKMKMLLDSFSAKSDCKFDIFCSVAASMILPLVVCSSEMLRINIAKTWKEITIPNSQKQAGTLQEITTHELKHVCIISWNQN